MEWLWFGAFALMVIVMFRNWCRREDERVRRMFSAGLPSVGESKAAGSVLLGSERKTKDINSGVRQPQEETTADKN